MEPSHLCGENQSHEDIKRHRVSVIDISEHLPFIHVTVLFQYQLLLEVLQYQKAKIGHHGEDQGKKEKPPIFRPTHTRLEVEQVGKTCPHAFEEVDPASGRLVMTTMPMRPMGMFPMGGMMMVRT